MNPIVYSFFRQSPTIQVTGRIEFNEISKINSKKKNSIKCQISSFQSMGVLKSLENSKVFISITVCWVHSSEYCSIIITEQFFMSFSKRNHYEILLD